MASSEMASSETASLAFDFSVLSAPFQAAAAKKSVKVRLTVLDKDLKVIYSDEVAGTPGMMAKIAVSKGRSYQDGAVLQDPGMCKTICCMMCPWMWGCTKGMPVQGTVGFAVPGTEASCIVVNGAPAAHDDLAIVEEALAAAGFTKDGDGTYKPE